MAANDIGIDLGTSTVVFYTEDRGVILKEPTVIAIDDRHDTVIAIGEKAFEMTGRTPPHIQAVWPLSGGVISDYVLTREIIKQLLIKATSSRMIKPRACVCVPASVTEVEADAVVEAVQTAGARQVFLIDEPIAAALGAGMDIMRPLGSMVVDIGGGTTDIAVISMGGKVQSISIKVAGNTIDEAIVKTMREKYRLNIGPRMAERAKIEVGSCLKTSYAKTCVIKGMNVITGLPEKRTISSGDLYDPIMESVIQILDALTNVMERTPPELAGDVYTEGVMLTGGGALLTGLAEFLALKTGVVVKVADEPQNCVAKGAGMAFTLEDKLEAGFRDATIL